METSYYRRFRSRLTLASEVGLAIIPLVAGRLFDKLWHRSRSVPPARMSMVADTARRYLSFDKSQPVLYWIPLVSDSPNSIANSLEQNPQLIAITHSWSSWMSVRHHRFFHFPETVFYDNRARVEGEIHRLLGREVDLIPLEGEAEEVASKSNSGRERSRDSSTNGIDRIRTVKNTALPKVNLVDYEGGGWILSRIAGNLLDSLLRLGIPAEVSKTPLQDAPIVHHIIYLSARTQPRAILETSMVTHVDKPWKMDLIRKQASLKILPIAMSTESSRIVGQGLNPSITGNIPYAVMPPLVETSISKYTVGVFSRTYRDGRKREFELLAFASRFSPEMIKFRIVGSGWATIVQKLRKSGFEVGWSEGFETSDYIAELDSVDCALYFGWDEGAVGCIDALARGKRVIAPPVGYHLDYASPLLSFAYNGLEASERISSEVEERSSMISSMSTRTWDNYAEAHIDIWRYLVNRKT